MSSSCWEGSYARRLYASIMMTLSSLKIYQQQWRASDCNFQCSVPIRMCCTGRIILRTFILWCRGLHRLHFRSELKNEAEHSFRPRRLQNNHIYLYLIKYCTPSDVGVNGTPRSTSYGFVTHSPWETEAATTSEKKEFKARFFGNNFFTHIPWARRPSGFKPDCKADKKLRGVLNSQFDRPMLTIRHRTVKKSFFCDFFDKPAMPWWFWERLLLAAAICSPHFQARALLILSAAAHAPEDAVKSPGCSLCIGVQPFAQTNSR